MAQSQRQAPWSLAQASVLYVFIAILVSLATLLLGSATFLVYQTEAKEKRQQLLMELGTTADQVATSLALPVWYFDHQQVARLLDHLMDNQIVQEVAIELQTGRRESITRVRARDGVVKTDTVEPSPHEIAQAPGLLSVERPITYSGKILGRVHLAFTNRFVEAELRSTLTRGLASVICLDLLLITSVSLLLWRVVIRPLREIQRMAEAVSSGASAQFAPANRTFFGELASLHLFLGRTFELLEERFAALQHSEERFRVLVESTTDLIWSVDSSGRLLNFNTAFAAHIQRYLGRNPCMGDAAEALLPLDYVNVWPSISRGISTHGYFQREFTYQDGAVFEFSFNPIKRDNDVVAVSVFGKDISARQAAVKALAASEARARTMLQTAMDGVWLLDEMGRILEVNEAACCMLGYSHDEMCGLGISDIESAESMVEVDRHRLKVIQDGMDLFETEHRRKDGTLFPVEISVTFLSEQGRMVVFIRDISERKRAEESLIEREERYRTFFEHGPDGVVVLDPDTARPIEFNDQACSQLGYTREEFQQLTMADLEAKETAEETARRIQRVVESGFESFDTVQRTRTGELRDIHVTAQHIYYGGKEAYHCVWRDITERKAGERERNQLQIQLLQSQKMESLGRLAGGVAHDMNNVLGAILGLASAHVDSQPYGSPVHQALDTICKATERGGKMVKSLLSFARQSPAEERALDFNAIIMEQGSLLERTTLANVHLQLDLAADLRPIQGDASALAHALMNLCVNAVDAMPDNGTLTLRTRNVDPRWIEVVVEDTGTGMPTEILEKAFDPFFTTKEVGKGTGLGLSMVYTAVKANRGRLEILSEPGKGTRVMMRFPVCEGQLQGPEPSRPAVALAPRGAMKVLLVDDDELIQISMQAILETLGHRVDIAQSGEEALARLGTGLEVDVVILDMNMPGLGGAGTLPLLRTLRPALPVLLATGRTDQTALNLASAHPGVLLLPKPFGMKELQKHFEAIGLG